MDIHRLFDSQIQAKKRAALKATVQRLDLKISYRLMYELGERPGYRIETLKDVLLMLTFTSDVQKDEFFETLYEELDKPLTIGTGPYGVRAVEIVHGPTGTYFR
jgi:hypothetical protein